MIASIIIPAYNSAPTIGACIGALKSQKGVPKNSYEIIVVDDGSSDDTALRAKKLGAKVLRQENSGPAKARNLGAKAAHGKILLFTDADCIPKPTWLEQMLKPFLDKDVCGVQGAYRTSQPQLVARFVQLEIEERYERMKRHAASLDWVGSYSAAYRAKDFFAAGGFDESFPKASGEDPALSYKLSKTGRRLVFNPQAIVYHTHPDTMDKYFRVKFYRAYYRIGLYSKHADKIASDSYTPKTLKAQITIQYLSWGLLVAGIILGALGQFYSAWLFGVISLLFAVLHFLSTLPFFFFAGKKDIGAAAFGVIVGLPCRTTAFCLGLPAGMIGRAAK